MTDKYLICFDCSTEYSYLKEYFSDKDISVEEISFMHSLDKKKMKSATLRIKELSENNKVVILYAYHSMQLEFEDFVKELGSGTKAVLIPVGSDAIALKAHNISIKEAEKINRYVYYGGKENTENAGAFIAKEYFGLDTQPAEAKEVAFDGIFREGTEKLWHSLEEYLADTPHYDTYVGYLVHRSSWIKNNTEEAAVFEKYLNPVGIGVIPVFSNSNQNCRTFDEIVRDCFSIDGKLKIEGLINTQIFAVRAGSTSTVFEETSRKFAELDIPVYNPIHSYHTTVEEWRENNQPLTMDMPNAFITPEATGMIEPVITSAYSKDGASFEVIEEQVKYLCGRIAKWTALRKKKNSEKKVTLILHNSVCSGVEATIGKSYGLNAFESVVEIMKRLKAEGFKVNDIPENGAALLEMIQTRKAISDFRWTAVEDIIDCGGVLYRMNADKEYAEYFGKLPEELRKSCTETWGEAPGEGMVMGRDITITGINFGNVEVMVQPKRGCYGAKCTGEVCKILHDPVCPPPHQFIATYKYIENVFKADVCVDIGTEGCLEMLPGKITGLSTSCWPYAVLGSTPHLYIYNPGVPSEGMVAKRRSNAVIITHLPAAKRGIDTETALIAEKITDYFNAKLLGNGQEKDIEIAIKAMLKNNEKCAKVVENGEDFEDGLKMLLDASNASISGGRYGTKHVFGSSPEEEERNSYIKEVWRAENEEASERDPLELDKEYSGAIERALSGSEGEKEKDAADIISKLEKSEEEMDALVHLLSGGYIMPGESGMPDKNGRNIIPAGKNMHASNMGKVPTPLAYERGKKLAEDLLAAYLEDEGKLPFKVAMNMISLDVTRTNGEQLSQFLYLMGVKPVWDQNGKYRKLEVIPTEELGRPRIDVTVRISGVMRDTWPFAVNMMDDAVLLVSELDETEEQNYIIKNIREYEEEHGLSGMREKTARIFGDAPGSYGAGIDLALLASAWESEEDLTKYFIQASAFSYGNMRNGKKSIKEFIDNMKKADLSTDTSNCDRMNTINCGFGLQVQGGMKVLAKTLGKKDIKQYHSISSGVGKIETSSLKKALENDIRKSLLNPLWKEEIKNNGYDGVSEIMHFVQNVFASQCTSESLDDSVIDEITNQYINDEDMREWMSGKNKYAVEEVARRLLELQKRGKWDPDADTFEQLKENYLIIEGDIEDGLETKGDIQGGSVDIVNDKQVENWKKNLAEIEEAMKQQ